MSDHHDHDEHREGLGHDLPQMQDKGMVRRPVGRRGLLGVFGGIGAATLVLQGNTSTIFSGTFAGKGGLELDNGNTLTLTGTGGSSGTIGGDLDLCNCDATGGLTINGTALTVLGASQGVIVEGGTLSVINGGTLTVGPSPGGFSDLAVASTMVVDGTGSTVTVNGATGIVGAFLPPAALTVSGGGKLTSLGGAEIDSFFGKQITHLDRFIVDDVRDQHTVNLGICGSVAETFESVLK